MDLQKILKTLKLQENNISMILGILVLVVLSVFVYNYFKASKTEGQITTAQSTENSSQKHKVLKGETLWTIAQQYYKTGSDWKKIADANNISNPQKIEVGQELAIPETTADVSTATVNLGTESTASANVTSAIKGATYKVVKGDSLWKIAVRAYGDGYKWATVAKENKLKNPNVIHTGNILILPR